MTHIVALNFSYDVPVKLFSSHLLLMAVFLMWPDMERLANFFVLNRDVKTETITPVYRDKRTKFLYYIGKGLVVAFFIIPPVIAQINARRSIEDFVQKTSTANPALTGEYDVATFIHGGDTISEANRQTFRWNKVAFTTRQANIVFSNGSDMAWNFNSNTGYKRFIVTSPDLSTILEFKYEIADEVITARGVVNDKELVMTMKKIGQSEPLLVSRGFHWVNEYPYNR